MRSGTPTIDAAGRAFALLSRVIADGGRRPVSELGVEAMLPPATAHRIIKTLEASNYLHCVSRGHYVAGPALLTFAEHVRPERVAAAIARPHLCALARRTGETAHLGMLENEMVTYLVKEGRGTSSLFTREGMQLEAYCSGIGKTLLANLPEGAQDSYLANGPFIPLTPATITDPMALKLELEKIKDQGFAVDAREISPDLVCLAAPLNQKLGDAAFAISLSRQGGWASPAAQARALASLQKCAADISASMARYNS